MKRIIDISSDGKHLSRKRGFLLVQQNGEEIGRIALDEIYALVIHANGVTYTNSLLVSLAEHGAIVVLCGSNHFPLAYVTALDGHHTQAGRINSQIQASLPLKKQLWRSLVIEKIKMQAAVLEAFSIPNARLLHLSRRVKSGDPDNIEAQAARFYWPCLFGKSFTRDRQAEGINAMLNYGYTLLRASVARSIVASGLLPSLGVNHKSRTNAFALADDIIEPFRPLVDAAVKGLSLNGANQVTPDTKKVLTKLINLDLDLDEKRSPLTSVLNSICNSLVISFEEGKHLLKIAEPPTPIELRSLWVSDG
jgi:CRISP-associated protein Cas1